MIVCHLPEDGSGANAYGRLFREALRRRGATVIPLPGRLLFAPGIFRLRANIVHFEFIDAFVLPHRYRPALFFGLIKSVLFLAQVAVLRLAGIRLYWTVHHPGNYEGRLPRLERLASVIFVRLSRGLFVHSVDAIGKVRALYFVPARVEIHHHPHPNYIGAYPDSMSRQAARSHLGVAEDACMILCFGQLRRYKNLPEAARCFVEASGGASMAELWVVGAACDPGVLQELRAVVADGAKIRVKSAHIPDEAVQIYFRACDFVLQNYEIPSSGATALAMSFACPVIAPKSVTNAEWLADDGAILFSGGDSAALVAALLEAIARADSATEMGLANLRVAQSWSWDDAGANLYRIYVADGG